MATKFPPPPAGNAKDQFDKPAWQTWFYQLYKLANVFTSIDFAGSTILAIESRNHNDLQNMQGGTTNQYYHFSAANYTALTGGSSTTLHYHSSDRVWSNLTGTPTTLAGYGVTAVAWSVITGTPTTLSGYGISSVVVAGTIQSTTANSIKSSDGSVGITTTITTGSLVGKTITIKDGLITGFA